MSVSLKTITILFFLIATFHILAVINHWYWKFPWIDIPAHVTGGIWLGMIFFYFIYPRLQITNYQLPITIFLAVSFVALLGVLWEFYEFSYDFFISKSLYFGNNFLIEKRIDVIKDLFFDLVGGLLFSLWALGKTKTD